jgi:hypothetical protein
MNNPNLSIAPQAAVSGGASSDALRPATAAAVAAIATASSANDGKE